MSSELFPLTECTSSDVASMARIFNSAFASNPFHNLLYAGVSHPTRTQHFIDTSLPKFSQPEIHMYKITDSSTGEMVGFSRWGFPHIPAPPKIEEGSGIVAAEKVEVKEATGGKVRIIPESYWPEGTNYDLADAKFGSLIEWRKKYVDMKEMYICYMLYVEPKYQGKGFGRRLMNVVLEQADAARQKAWLEGTPAGYPLYESLGFKDVDRATLSAEDFGGLIAFTQTNVAMMREPKDV